LQVWNTQHKINEDLLILSHFSNSISPCTKKEHVRNNEADHVCRYEIHGRKQMKIYLFCNISATPYHHAFRKEHVRNNEADHVCNYGIRGRKQLKIYLFCHISATPYHHALRKEHVRGLYTFIA
jgi:hypothetical protein